MLAQQQAQHIAEQWIEDWNRHDLEAILSHYADSIEFTSPFIVKLLGNPTGIVQGKLALRNYFERGLAAYPQLKFELITVLTGVNSLVVHYYSVNQLQSAEFMIFDQAGLVSHAKAHYC